MLQVSNPLFLWKRTELMTGVGSDLTHSTSIEWSFVKESKDEMQIAPINP